MAKSKRILSAILSVLMVLTMIPMGIINATAEDSIDTEATSTLPDGQLVVPTVTLESTPIIRTADSSCGYLPGTTIVAATPSGLGQMTGAQSNGYYANETPVSATVVLTTDKSLDEDPSLTCENNTNVQLTGPIKSGNTYTWTVTGGSNVETGPLYFVAGYKYTYTDSLTGNQVTKSYKAYATSSVEKVSQPGGMYTTYRRKYTGHSSAFSVYTWRIVGANVFGSFYNPTDATSTWSHGTYRWDTTAMDVHLKDDADSSYFNAIASSAAGAAGYGMAYDEISSSTTGNVTTNTDLDQNRPISTIYIQKGYSLDSYNLRASVYEANNPPDSRQFNHKIRAYRIFAGDATWNEDSADSNAARAQLGMEPLTADTLVGKLSVTDFPMTGTAYTDALALNETTGNYESQYTIMFDVGCRDDSNSRDCFVKSAVDLHIVAYDKEDLLGTLSETIKEQILTTPYAADSEAGINPNEQFYSAGWAEYKAALQNAQFVYNDPDTTQKIIDAAVTRLKAAVAALEVKEADYTAVNDAINTANGLNSTLYTDDSWLNLQSALNSAKKGYSIFFQCAVDKFATDITSAISALEYRPADYDEVNALIEKFNGLIESQYTPESWKTLKDAVASVVPGKNASEQSVVDGYRDTIATAMSQLVYSPADYTEVKNQVTRYEQVLKDKEYYKVLLWRAVDAAYQSIDYTKDWRYQSDVDLMASNLKKAIDNLEYDSADYSAVNEAIDEANALTASWYTAESWKNLRSKISAVDYTLNKTQQETVNGYVTAINQAIGSLVETIGDYTEVNNAITRANGLVKEYYTDTSWTNLQNAISAVDETKLARYQDEIDSYAVNINNAIDSLVEYAANYNEVNGLISQWNGMANKTNYTDETVLAVQDAVNAVDFSLKISKQTTVDGYADAIQAALNNLKLKKADYKAVDTAVAAAREYVNKQSSYAILYHGNLYYTSETFEILTGALSAIDYTLDITHQEEVNQFATNIVNAYGALEYGTADYTAVNVAIAKVPTDLDQENLYDENLAAAVLLAQLDVEEDYPSNRQSEVDEMAKNLEDAIAALKYKSADYTAVDNLIGVWNAYPNKDTYTADSVRNVDNAVAAVIRGYDVRNQEIVNAMAQTIQNAIDNLGVDVADYSQVDIAIAAGTAAKSALYTDESNKAVDDAINAVVRGLKSAEQTRVTGFAVAINNAISGLTYKKLDLTSYNTVVAKIPANYDKYTTASVNRVNTALAAANNFIATKNDIRNQSEFEVYVTSLDTAISELTVAGADYTAVDEAIRSTTNLTPSYYENWSAVETALGNVQRDLDITKQDDVNTMAKNINDAVKALVLKAADYKVVDDAKAKIPEDLSQYREDSVATLNNAVNAVKTNLTIDKQAVVDGYAQAILEAIDNLCYVTGDYTELNALVASAKKLDGSIYSNYNDVYYNTIYPYITNTIQTHRNYTIAEQDKIDEMKVTLQGYIDTLVLKNADYTALNAIVKTANEKIETGYYYEDGVKNLQDEIGTIDYSLNILSQDAVDLKAAKITELVDALVEKPADFSKIDALYKEIKNYDSNLYTNYVEIFYGNIYKYYNKTVKAAKINENKISNQGKVDEMYNVLLGYKNLLESVTDPSFIEKMGSTTKFYDKDSVNYIEGIKTGLTQKQFLEDCVEYANVVVEVNKSNSKVFVGTGSKVIVKDETTGTVLEEHYIVVNGDINGDGKVNNYDFDILNRIVSGTDVTSGAYYEAADVNGDGNVDAFDLTALGLILTGATA